MWVLHRFPQDAVPHALSYLQIVVVRLVAQFLAIDGVGRHIALIIVDNNEALTGHGNQFR